MISGVKSSEQAASGIAVPIRGCSRMPDDCRQFDGWKQLRLLAEAVPEAHESVRDSSRDDPENHGRVLGRVCATGLSLQKGG